MTLTKPAGEHYNEAILRGSRTAPVKEESLVVKSIEITDIGQVERINALACKTPYEVWLSDDVLMLDARSLLGLFSLVGKRVNVIAEDDVNPKAFDKLVAKMA